MLKKLQGPKTLGRVYVEDKRDANFPLSTAITLGRSQKVYKYWWSSGWWGNQGNLPHCVAFSWMHWLEDGPITHFYKGRDFDPYYLTEDLQSEKTLFNTKAIYEAAQKVDMWPGEDYEGTSVRAGAKILRGLGVISEFRWATTIDEIVECLLEHGPMVVGTWWHYDMFFPNENGVITPTGPKSGGHAYLLNGINLKKRIIRIKNSWGREWGKDGHAYIKIEDFEKLLKDYGEACMAFEKKLKE